ncbi:MAG: hypothetical protein CMO81_04520 [Waddliaceae bacterium]|nr:hypothetical protein [Waddliaceae bacterium]
MFRSILCLCILSISYGFLSLNAAGYDLSLVPEKPPKSRILGVQFGSSPAVLARSLAKMGLILIGQEQEGIRGEQRKYRYQGIPQGMEIRNGESEFLFYENELIGMNLYFPPSYRNFLTVRHQLINSMGDRFKVDKKQEAMEPVLRTQLAHLRKNEFSSHSEEAISKSMNQGNTFFYYFLDDTRNELNVRLSFASRISESGNKIPQLKLHYSLQSAVEKMQNTHDKADEKDHDAILPNTDSLL